MPVEVVGVETLLLLQQEQEELVEGVMDLTQLLEVMELRQLVVVEVVVETLVDLMATVVLVVPES